MALQKEITTNSGVVGNYLRIVKISSVDIRTKIAEIVVSLFLNKEASDSGKSPLQSKSFKVEIDDVNGNIRQQSYAKLKIFDDTKPKGWSTMMAGKFNDVLLKDAKDV